MRSLLPLYQSDSIQCSDIESTLHSTRRQCLLDAGLCDAANADFFIEEATELGGYPVKIPLWYNGPSQPVGVTYFRQTSLVKAQVSLLSVEWFLQTVYYCVNNTSLAQYILKTPEFKHQQWMQTKTF